MCKIFGNVLFLSSKILFRIKKTAYVSQTCPYRNFSVTRNLFLCNRSRKKSYNLSKNLNRLKSRYISEIVIFIIVEASFDHQGLGMDWHVQQSCLSFQSFKLSQFSVKPCFQLLLKYSEKTVIFSENYPLKWRFSRYGNRFCSILNSIWVWLIFVIPENLNWIESDVTLVCYGNNNAQRATDRLCTHIGMVQKRTQIVLKRIEKKIFDDFDRLHEKVKKRRSV